MGSFQQVLMGLTCLVAAFFFGSYLHNRPAKNDQAVDSQVAAMDPLESIFSFGRTNLKEPVGLDDSLATVDVAKLQSPKSDPRSTTNSAIHDSERVPVFNNGATKQQEKALAAVQSKAPSVRKPIVPDFSDLASRFRNSPLQLETSANEAQVERNAVHESERVPTANAFENVPQVVIRKPEKLTPLSDFTNQVDRIEESIRGEFAQPDRNSAQDSGRWRVNRSKRLDQFRANGQIPQQDTRPRQTIEDIVARDSTDYLLESDDAPKTFATDPIQGDWASAQRQQVTQKAAVRNRDILDIEDPGKRFHSVLTQATPTTSPIQDYETDYYAPADPDSVKPQSNVGMSRIRKAQETNWQRRSNIRSGFENVGRAAANGSSTYRIQPGDTLQSISTRFYGVPDHYLALYKANRRVLDQITSSPAGVEIEIPDLNN